MAHHKRKRPKHQRAGCLSCKPWKDERASKSPTASNYMGDNMYTPAERRKMEPGELLAEMNKLDPEDDE